MSKIYKILLVIFGFLASAIALASQSKSKKQFNKKVKANDEKLDFITKGASKVKKEKASTKSKIQELKLKIKDTKSKIKSTKTSKKTIKDFESKYRK